MNNKGECIDMDLVGKKAFANHTVFSYVGKVKVKKTLEGHFAFDETGFYFKKNIVNKVQGIYYDDVRIEYKDIKDIRPLNYGPIHTIMIIETKDGKPYRFGTRKRDEIIEFLKEKMEVK